MRSALLMALIGGLGCGSFHAAVPPGAPDGSKFLEIDGVPMHYSDDGAGPTVVLIHGFASSLAVWRFLGPELVKRGHRVVAMDLKGFGYSGRPAGDYSPAAQARLVRGLLDRLGVERASLVAHSWGSGVALALALDQPERVERLVLMSAYVYDEQVPPFYRWSQMPGIGPLVFAMFYRQGAEERIPLAFHDPKWATQERVEAVIEDSEMPGAQAAALAAVQGQVYDELARSYRTIDRETLLVWGKNDVVTPVRFAYRLRADLPKARLLTYEQCGHMPMFEAIQPVTREIVEFLAPSPSRADAPESDASSTPGSAEDVP